MKDAQIKYPQFELDKDENNSLLFRETCEFLYSGPVAWAVDYDLKNRIDYFLNLRFSKYDSVRNALFDTFTENPTQSTLQDVNDYKKFLIPYVESDGCLLRETKFGFYQGKPWICYPKMIPIISDENQQNYILKEENGFFIRNDYDYYLMEMD